MVNRGVDRQPIVFDDRDRVEFMRLLGVIHERFGIIVHAFCLMTNHFHLLLECPQAQLSEAMHLHSSVFVRHVNDRAGRDGPLFKDRFYAKPVRSDEYTCRLVTYIHRNPLAIVAADRLVDFRWSSLRSYLGMRRPPVWLRTDFMAGLLGRVDEIAATTVGSRQLPAMTGHHADVDALIELMFDEHLGVRARRGSVRTVATLLLDRLPADLSKGIIEGLEFPTVNAERLMRSRSRQRAERDPNLSVVADAVADFLGGCHFVPGTK